MTLDLDFVLAATGGSAWRTRATHFSSVSIDGRACKPGALWFAIRGERFDGHDFAGQAVMNGAAAVVAARGRGGELSGADEVTVIEVDDPMPALGALGRAHRERLAALEVVGVTGSNGKTTTKELVAAILAAHAGDAAVHKTEGNLNNHLGLPLTLLGLEERHRYAVIEMGMSARGEIAYLAGLARPHVGVIVNAGPVHLETLGSVDEVARAKGELFVELKPWGTAVYPDGDPRLAAQAAASPAVRKVRFGDRPGVEVRLVESRVRAEGTDVILRLPDGEVVRARIAAVGAHNAVNAAAAAACAHALGVPAATIAAGLARFRPAKHRSQVVDVGGRKVIDDCYNASPLSTAAALEALAALKGNARAVAVLGDMLELGPNEAMLHRNIGQRAAELGIDSLITVGARARHIADGARAAGVAAIRLHQAASPDEAAARAAAISRPGDWILIKGSRGMKLEQVVEALPAHFAAMPQTGGR